MHSETANQERNTSAARIGHNKVLCESFVSQSVMRHYRVDEMDESSVSDHWVSMDLSRELYAYV